MTPSDDAFLQRLRATFRVEAEEHLQALSTGLLELEQDRAAGRKPEIIEEVFRRAHSLKGAARASSFAGVEAVCQTLEDVFARWKRREFDPAPEDFDTLQRALDLVSRLILSDEGPATREEDQSVLAALRQLGRMVPATAAPAASVPIAPVAAVPVAELPVAGRPVAAETIRIATDKLDRLLLQTEELLAVKQSAAQRAVELRELEQVLSDWDRRWTRLQPRLRALRDTSDAPVREFLDWNLGCVKALEGRLHALAKATTHDRQEVGRRVDDLLADAKQLVMLPFSTLADLLPKLVRDLAREQGKEVDLVIRGGEIEIDKRILEEMKDPLIHLVRNALDHGVEKPALRAQRRKPARATLAVGAATVEGNKVEIVVADDGGGIDLARVRDAAVRRSLVTTAEAQALDDRRALDLIFESEVSTSPIITELSGRGLGLAIVREKAGKLGGRVAVENRPEAGTAFRIVLPLTLATFRGLLVRVVGQVFVVPLAHVAKVARFAPGEIRTVENRETILLANRALALVRLEQVLELARPAVPAAAPGPVTAVVLGSGETAVAFGVDEVLHDEEVLVKVFARPLSRVRNIAGATIIASGGVAPLLNVSDLLKSARRSGAVSRATAPGAPAPAARGPAQSVLLAEDSITSRLLLKGILESAGYRVTTAVDGVDALTALRTGEFDLVVSDIEMPRLNGFDLTARIRADERLADLPVVLVTALASAADREHGVEAGANAYIVKSSFDQSDLLAVIRRLVG